MEERHIITKQKTLFFFVNDQPFKTLAEAQIYDLKAIIAKCDDERIPELSDTFADFMLKNSAEIVNCLTTTPTSRAKARKTNGATKKSPKRPKLQPAELPKE